MMKNIIFLLSIIPVVLFLTTFASAIISPFCTPKAIFNDSFEGAEWAGGWIESGEGDWNIEAANTGITQVGVSVAHVDNCDTYCNLTSANFSCLGQDECFLTYNYGTSGFDADEYMSIDVWNVTNKVWNINVINYTGTVAGTNYINLSRFGLGQNNSIRISMRATGGSMATNEHGEIDVVNVTGGSVRFAGGLGIAADPFEISNWTHLNRTRQCLDANYSLIANLSSSTGDYSGLATNWTYGGATFTGNFYGNNNRIHDLIINSSGGGGGLFSATSGNISDLSLINFSLITGTYSGMLNSNTQGGWIKYVKVINSSITGTNSLGGISGGYTLQGGIILSSNVTNVIILGTSELGGIIGYGHRLYDTHVDNVSIILNVILKK